MGGHLAGDVAADLAIGLLDGALEPGGVPDGPTLVAAIERANAAIRAEAVARPDQRGMGTTCTALVVGDTVTIAHVGDSRAYRSRGGRLEQLTEDHSLVAALVREGRLDPDAAPRDPRRHVITRALGAEDGIRVDVVTVDRLPGDRFLLCSDGIHGQLDDATIGRVLAGTSEPGAAADELVALADAAGGEDNATVVVIDADRVAPGAGGDPGRVGCAGPGRPAPIEAWRGRQACCGAHRPGAHRCGGGLAGRGRTRSRSADPVDRRPVGRIAIGCRAVGVGARAFSVEPRGVAVAVTRGPGPVRLGRDPDAVVRGAGAILTAARPPRQCLRPGAGAPRTPRARRHARRTAGPASPSRSRTARAPSR